MRKGALVACGIVGVITVVTLFASRPGPDLRRLRDDRLAKYLPKGATETYRHEVGKARLPILGATPRAKISRRIGSCRRHCFESLINEAVRSGWKFPDGVNQRADTKTLYRRLQDRYLLLIVSEHDVADPREVGILLLDERLPLPQGWST